MNDETKPRWEDAVGKRVRIGRPELGAEDTIEVVKAEGSSPWVTFRFIGWEHVLQVRRTSWELLEILPDPTEAPGGE